jgi:hypothetical protein
MAHLSARRIAFENLRQLAFGGIGVNYAIIGAPFSNPVRMLKVVNDTNTALRISYDGVNDQDYISANSAFIYDYGTNKSDYAESLEQPKMEAIYVKQDDITAAIIGKVSVTVIYASQH